MEITEIKTLANCKPTEFISQTVKIKKCVKEWLSATNIIEIWEKQPELTKISKYMSDEEKLEIFKSNKKIATEFTRKKLSDIFDIILEKYPAESLKLMALCCFIDPEDADNYPVTRYLRAITEILNDETVIDFFSSLTGWGKKNTNSESKA